MVQDFNNHKIKKNVSVKKKKKPWKDVPHKMKGEYTLKQWALNKHLLDSRPESGMLSKHSLVRLGSRWKDIQCWQECKPHSPREG